jgi:hypothetical protein
LYRFFCYLVYMKVGIFNWSAFAKPIDKCIRGIHFIDVSTTYNLIFENFWLTGSNLLSFSFYYRGHNIIGGNI